MTSGRRHFGFPGTANGFGFGFGLDICNLALLGDKWLS